MASLFFFLFFFFFCFCVCLFVCFAYLLVCFAMSFSKHDDIYLNNSYIQTELVSIEVVPTSYHVLYVKQI